MIVHISSSISNIRTYRQAVNLRTNRICRYTLSGDFIPIIDFLADGIYEFTRAIRRALHQATINKAVFR